MMLRIFLFSFSFTLVFSLTLGSGISARNNTYVNATVHTSNARTTAPAAMPSSSRNSLFTSPSVSLVQVASTVTGIARDRLLYSIAKNSGIYGDFIDLSETNLPETGTGFAYALTCNALSVAWSSRLSNLKSRFPDLLSSTPQGPLTTAYTTTIVTNYTYSKATTLCDGQARIDGDILPITTWIHVETTTVQTMSWAHDNLYPSLAALQPNCRFNKADCDSLIAVRRTGEVPSCSGCWNLCRITAGSIDLLYSPLTATASRNICQAKRRDIQDENIMSTLLISGQHSGTTAQVNLHRLIRAANTKGLIGRQQDVIQDNATYAEWNGQLFDLAKAYMVIETAFAENSCGHRFGKSFPGTIFTLSSAALTTMAMISGGMRQIDRSIDFEDFNTPLPISVWGPIQQSGPFSFCDAQAGTICTHIYHGPRNNTLQPKVIEDEYHPTLILPEALKSLDAEWGKCNYLWPFAYGFDPPRALHVETTLVPEKGHTTIIGPAPGASPIPAGSPRTTHVELQPTPIPIQNPSQPAGESRENTPTPADRPAGSHPDPNIPVAVGSNTIYVLPTSRGILLPNGQTLPPGSATWIGDTFLSLDPDQRNGMVVFSGKTSFLPLPTIQPGPGYDLEVPVEGSMLHLRPVTSGAGFILPNGQTLSLGSATIISGQTISAGPSGNVIVVNSTTLTFAYTRITPPHISIDSTTIKPNTASDPRKFEPTHTSKTGNGVPAKTTTFAFSLVLVLLSMISNMV